MIKLIVFALNTVVMYVGNGPTRTKDPKAPSAEFQQQFPRRLILLLIARVKWRDYIFFPKYCFLRTLDIDVPAHRFYGSEVTNE